MNRISKMLNVGVMVLGLSVLVSCSTEATPASKPSFKTIEYDGCEYVFGNPPPSYGAVLAHKGNCKYCAERNKPQIKVLHEPVFRVPKEPVRHTTQCWWLNEPADFPPSLK